MIRPWLREARRTGAEALAFALAERFNAPLVPTDHHVFEAIERQGHVCLRWRRAF
jgi:hypothetical protein